jgi:hypothetical protein
LERFVADGGAAALLFLGTLRVGFGILGGVATVVGLCLVSNFADVAVGAVEQMRHSRWSAPAMANVNYLRLFGLAFGAIGVIFLILALTNNIHTRSS